MDNSISFTQEPYVRRPLPSSTEITSFRSNDRISRNLTGARQASITFDSKKTPRLPEETELRLKKFIGNKRLSTTGGESEFRRAKIVSLVNGKAPPERNDLLLERLRAHGLSKEEKKEIHQRMDKNKKYVQALAKKMGAGKNANNNIEHVIPQSILSDKNRAQASEIEKKITAEICGHALNYHENRDSHKNHASTRWLQKNGCLKHVWINWERTQIIKEKVLRFDSQQGNPGEDFGRVSFDQAKGMHYLKEEGIYFNNETNLYYDGEYTFFDSNGSALRVINKRYGDDAGARKLPDEFVANVIRHEYERILYNRNVSGLLRNEKAISAAVQINQLEYAHSARLSERKSDAKSILTDRLASESFRNMLQEAESVVYIENTESLPESGMKKINILKLNISSTDKVEMAVARLTVETGNYPSKYDLQIYLQGCQLDGELACLNKMPAEKDKAISVMDFFTALRHVELTKE